MKHKVISLCAALLATISIAPLGASAAKTAIDTSNNAPTSTPENSDESRFSSPVVPTSTQPVDPSSVNLLTAKKRHIVSGVNKLVSHSMTHTTAYISKNNCKMALQGVTQLPQLKLSGVIVRGLLIIAGITTPSLVKGGIRLEITYVKDWNGAYHQTLTGWGWQYSK